MVKFITAILSVYQYYLGKIFWSKKYLGKSIWLQKIWVEKIVLKQSSKWQKMVFGRKPFLDKKDVKKIAPSMYFFMSLTSANKGPPRALQI